jgi:tetratricopeptide (TPR) repeat protein
MKRLMFVCTFLFSCSLVFAQHGAMPQLTNDAPARLMSGLGSLHHEVSTNNEEAQQFFNQGVTFIYAFNHDEAIRSFKRAAELDPKMAMAYWGIAYALGPNINLDVDPEREKAAYETAQQALKLSTNASEKERDYIAALVRRYSNDPKADLKKLALDFKNAMGELTKKYPDDLDAAVLYAESIMNLNPWKLWTKDGKPADGTLEAIAALESVLKRNPDHIGAIHYYIHAVEASPNPERALPYVAALPKQVPAAGHLVHMPAHIYMRTGDYIAAAKSNKEAAEADEAFFKSNGANGFYSMNYYPHNIHFEAIASATAGIYSESIETANKLEELCLPYLKEMPMLEGYAATAMQVNVRFRKWDEVLKKPQPDKDFVVMNAFRHFSRGMAFAAMNKLSEAEKEQNLFIERMKAVKTNTPFGLNSQTAVLKVADKMLAAQIAKAKRDYKTATALLKQAVAAEDELNYDEPPGWWLFARESLGGSLLMNKKAAEAEKVFREDLKRNPKNGRSLFGLIESLKAQGKTKEAEAMQKEFSEAWKAANVKLKIEEL